MQKKQIKFAVGSGVIVLTIAYLIFTGVSKTSSYYLSIPELLDQGSSLYGSGIRLKGNVLAGSIDRDRMKLKLDFRLTDESEKSIPIHYEGVVPDLFKEGLDVIVEGHISPNGIFQASILLTSCPSKYEGEKGEQGTK